MATRTALGIDVGGTTTKAGIVTPDGEIVVRVERPSDPSAATKGALAVADELLEKSGDFDVVAVGVGAAGFVQGSTIHFSPNLTYDDPQIGAALGARTDLPVVVDNDANVAAWGERAF